MEAKKKQRALKGGRWAGGAIKVWIYVKPAAPDSVLFGILSPSVGHSMSPPSTLRPTLCKRAHSHVWGGVEPISHGGLILAFSAGEVSGQTETDTELKRLGVFNTNC